LNKKIHSLGGPSGAASAADDVSDEDSRKAQEAKRLSELLNTWLELQVAVNYLVDSKAAAPHMRIPPGVTQILEKKEGMFRKHMMGKRVNFAARSVIAVRAPPSPLRGTLFYIFQPDVNLETNQIGVPRLFATTLTFAEPVTAFNYSMLHDAVPSDLSSMILCSATFWLPLQAVLLLSDRSSGCAWPEGPSWCECRGGRVQCKC
jgi:DNA-directed RNA polymerase beta' subunit